VGGKKGGLGEHGSEPREQHLGNILRNGQRGRNDPHKRGHPGRALLMGEKPTTAPVRKRIAKRNLARRDGPRGVGAPRCVKFVRWGRIPARQVPTGTKYKGRGRVWRCWKPEDPLKTGREGLAARRGAEGLVATKSVVELGSIKQQPRAVLGGKSARN